MDVPYLDEVVGFDELLPVGEDLGLGGGGRNLEGNLELEGVVGLESALDGKPEGHHLVGLEALPALLVSQPRLHPILLLKTINHEDMMMKKTMTVVMGTLSFSL